MSAPQQRHPPKQQIDYREDESDVQTRHGEQMRRSRERITPSHFGRYVRPVAHGDGSGQSLDLGRQPEPPYPLDGPRAQAAAERGFVGYAFHHVSRVERHLPRESATRHVAFVTPLRTARIGLHAAKRDDAVARGQIERRIGRNAYRMAAYSHAVVGFARRHTPFGEQNPFAARDHLVHDDLRSALIGGYLRRVVSQLCGAPSRHEQRETDADVGSDAPPHHPRRENAEAEADRRAPRRHREAARRRDARDEGNERPDHRRARCAMRVCNHDRIIFRRSTDRAIFRGA